MEKLKILELDYFEALSISSHDDFQIHLKIETNACFLNSYFVEGQQAWKVSIDINQCLIIIRQRHTCVHTFQKEKIKHQTP